MAVWSLEDDKFLWSVVGDKPRNSSGKLSRSAGVGALVTKLADRFGRTEGAITSRVKHLDNPEHSAYKRFHVNTRSSTSHLASPKRSSIATAAAPSLLASPKRSSIATAAAPSLLISPKWRSTATAAAAARNIAAASSGSTDATGSSSSNGSAISASQLTDEQRTIAKRVLGGENIFLTGAAGTGKSYLFKYIVQELKIRYGDNGEIAVTAPTGVAAVNVGGTTIHSFGGVGLGRGDAQTLLAKVCKSNKAMRNWQLTRVLLIDEISMLDMDLFEKLAWIGSQIRPNNASAPFGGIQVVACGDFFQLPPVGLKYSGFAFEAPAWRALEMKLCNLEQIIRQRGDSAFMEMLNEIRLGRLSDLTQHRLMECHVDTKQKPNDGILPTKLFCVNCAVDEENVRRLEALGGQPCNFTADDKFQRVTDKKSIEQAAEGRVPKILSLKIGAQVVLLRNLSDDLVNGSRGVVIDFVERHGRISPRVRFDNAKVLLMEPTSFWIGKGVAGSVDRTQFPLKLAWALTVHKSQGMTLSRAEVQVSNAFDYGQVYVALSRCVSRDGLWISGPPIVPTAVKAHREVLRFYGH